MTYENCLRLLKAVHAGRIKGQASHTVLGIGPSAFWSWVKEAERRGVVFEKNGRGGIKRGPHATKAQAWKVRRWGSYARERPIKRAAK